MISPIKIWRRQKVLRGLIGKQGRIVTWTRIHVAGTDFRKESPFFVVMVAFKKGGQAFGQLVDTEERTPQIGLPVVSILRRVRRPTEDGTIAYGLKFKPT